MDTEPEQPEPVEPETVTRRVVCGGCRTEYTFEADPTVSRFSCICPECGTKSTWHRDNVDS